MYFEILAWEKCFHISQSDVSRSRSFSSVGVDLTVSASTAGGL